MNYCKAEQGLSVASATRVGASTSLGMSVGTGIRAVVFALFLDGVADIDDTQARSTSAFHLGNSDSRHDRSPPRAISDTI